MLTDPFPPETHPCLLHLEVHPLTRLCWDTIAVFYVDIARRRPTITDRELQEAYDEAFERACLDFHARTHHHTDLTGFADQYLAAAGLNRLPTLVERHAVRTYPTLTEFLGALA